MEPGDVNKNGQEFVRRTGKKSTTHDYATIWVMRCPTCRKEYGSNSCDAHNRRCPLVRHGVGRIGKPPEPIH